MTKVYLNYPNPHVTIHGQPACSEIGKMRKPNQRDVEVNTASFAQAIQQFSSGFRLGADASVNDLWMSVDFGDAEFEDAVVRYVHRLLARRYSPLQGAAVERHC